MAQAHAEFAVDGLAPAGTVSPIPIGPADVSRVTRAGMIFNWVPDRILYITDPVRNVVTALTLTTDDKVFRLKDARHFAPKELDAPVDLAPVVPEVANPGFSSNTTMAGGSDIYVANRGNGTIVRCARTGRLSLIRRIVLPDGRDLGPDLLNGIAVSPDAQKIWVTVSGALPDMLVDPALSSNCRPLVQDALRREAYLQPTLAAHEVKPVNWPISVLSCSGLTSHQTGSGAVVQCALLSGMPPHADRWWHGAERI